MNKINESLQCPFTIRIIKVCYSFDMFKLERHFLADLFIMQSTCLYQECVIKVVLGVG